jgi:hypothetical protein
VQIIVVVLVGEVRLIKINKVKNTNNKFNVTKDYKIKKIPFFQNQCQLGLMIRYLRQSFEQ